MLSLALELLSPGDQAPGVRVSHKSLRGSLPGNENLQFSTTNKTFHSLLRSNLLCYFPDLFQKAHMEILFVNQNIHRNFLHGL